jgi:hypothetical protein
MRSANKRGGSPPKSFRQYRRAKLPFGESLNLIDYLMKENLLRFIERQLPMAGDVGE